MKHFIATAIRLSYRKLDAKRKPLFCRRLVGMEPTHKWLKTTTNAWDGPETTALACKSKWQKTRVLLRLGSTYVDLRKALNQALLEENANVSDNVAHLPFHFDYVDAKVENAQAILYADHAFILVMTPLIERIWQTAGLLSRSATICQVLNIHPASSDLIERLQAVFFSIQSSFLVCHEYTHHIHEHLVSGASNKLEEQAQEADAYAYAYATYIVLAHLFDEALRTNAMDLIPAKVINNANIYNYYTLPRR